MLTKRVVAITGASAGIGHGAAGGARRKARLDAAAMEVERAAGSALPIGGDVACDEDMQRLVACAVQRFGALDVMMCNAGYGIAGAVDDISPDQMRKIVDINCMGT